MMQLIIERASAENYWYADEIGETFDILSEADGCYCVGEGDSLLVVKEDCRILTDITNK